MAYLPESFVLYYLPVKKGAAGDAHSHANLSCHRCTLMHERNISDDADNQTAGVDQRLVFIDLRHVRIPDKVSDDVALQNRLQGGQYDDLRQHER